MAVQLQAFQTDAPHNPDHEIIVTGDAFDRMMNRMRAAKALTFDFETSGSAWFQHAQACGLALSTWEDNGRILSYYIPFRHETGEPQLDVNRVSPAFKELLENPLTMKIAHNIKFDAHMARREGWHVQGPRYDTMVAARLYDENKLIGLKHRAKSDLGHMEVDSWEKELNQEIARRAKQLKMGLRKYRSQYGYAQIPINMCGTYACYDAHYTTELYFHYERWGVSRKYTRIWPTEMALTEVIGDMEWIGLPIDVEYLENLRDSLGGQKAALEEKIFKVTKPFKLSSDAALRRYLLNELKLPLHKETKSSLKKKWKKPGEEIWAVDREVLDEFADRHASLPLIAKWRDADKLENTYTTSLLGLLDGENILHANFQQVGTDTGRLSCKEPNFQNQPADDDDRAVEYSGKHLSEGGVDPWSIRRAFTARDPKIPRLFFDYSQVELRVLAFYSRDPVMTDAYLKGEDIHSRTSLEVFGTDAKEKRRMAKIINFGLSYCMSSRGFARQAKVPEADAEEYLSKFFERYAGVSKFRDELWSRMFYNGCEVDNIFGRTRRLPDLNADENWKRNRAQRQAIGSLIQGTAAELTKESLVRVYNFLKSEYPDARLVNTVHDEIQIDCPADCLTPVVKEVKRMMEDFNEFSPIPIVVDGDYTITNWAEKKALPC
jgi:DNA polymerase-1